MLGVYDSASHALRSEIDAALIYKPSGPHSSALAALWTLQSGGTRASKSRRSLGLSSYSYLFAKQTRQLCGRNTEQLETLDEIFILSARQLGGHTVSVLHMTEAKVS